MLIAGEMKLLWVVVGYGTAVSYVSAQPGIGTITRECLVQAFYTD